MGSLAGYEWKGRERNGLEDGRKDGERQESVGQERVNPHTQLRKGRRGRWKGKR